LKLVEDSCEMLVEVLEFLLGAHGGRKKLGHQGPIVISSENLSRKYFWNFIQLLIEPIGRLKYHVESEFSNV
jgi:hypothetical protein